MTVNTGVARLKKLLATPGCVGGFQPIGALFTDRQAGRGGTVLPPARLAAEPPEWNSVGRIGPVMQKFARGVNSRSACLPQITPGNRMLCPETPIIAFLLSVRSSPARSLLLLAGSACRFCWLLLPALVTTGCLQEKYVEPTLTAAMQEGLNTAGCQVNGSNWTPYNAGIFSDPSLSASWRKQNNTGKFTLRILLDRNDDENATYSQTGLSFYVADVRSAGTFELDQPADPTLWSTNPAYATVEFTEPTPNQVYLTVPTATGRLLVIRFDTVAKIVAGTFESTAVQQSGTMLVRVTDGRFDLKFN